MKVPQWFVPKARLIKVANDRLKETMQYVNIDSSVASSDQKMLSGYKESLARFAQRHNIAVDFKKAENSDATLMDIYRTYTTPKSNNRRMQGLWYLETPEYRTTANLPKQDTPDFFINLKKMIKSLSYTENELIDSKKFPQIIRHENKYYNYADK